MTTLPNGRLDSFKNRVWNTGLDRDRCRIVREPGVFKVAANASFREGQPVTLNTSGLVEVATGPAGLLGVAKANCMNLGRAVINETLTFTAAGQTRNLRRAAVVAGGCTAKVAGVAYEVYDSTGGSPASGDEFIVNFSAGTLQHNVANAVLTVFPLVVEVQYVIELTASDYEFEGRNFFNQLNDVVTQDNMVTVIQAPSVIYTTEYANPLTAATALAIGQGVTVSSGGLFERTATAADMVGRVISSPTASDPWLGIELFGSR